MTNKELIDKITEDIHLDRREAEAVSEEIDRELAKKKPDYDKIAALSNQYCEIIGADEEVDSSSEEHCQRILEAAQNYNPKKRMFKRVLAIAASLTFVVLSANFYTVSAYNMNIFKAIVHYANGGFSVDFTSKTETNDDPYGIREECSKYGIYPEVPTYLPEGFDLSSVTYNDFGICSDLRFNYDNKNMQITIDYQLYTNSEDMANTGFPCDEFNIEEITINGKPAIISKEDNQFTLVYAMNDILLTIFTQDVPYEECYKITESIK